MSPTTTGPATTFDCLWCGRAWTTRGPDDLEGWARLCPDCLGRAGDNPFLRFRLRAALAARAGGSAPTRPPERGPGSDAAEPTPRPESGPDPADADLVAYYEARAAEYDDWYLRRGRYERGPVHDTAWAAELDAAGRWLDGLPISGRIVELAAGTGWWSPLLAAKGELWASDAAPAPLERARERLLAHGLRAHLHVRDAWAEPEEPPAPADALVACFWLSHVRRDRTAAFLALVRRWLRPGGLVALLDSLPDPQSGAADHQPVADDRALRRLDDGREFTITKVHRTADELAEALAQAGFEDVRTTTTGRFFLLASARA